MSSQLLIIILAIIVVAVVAVAGWLFVQRRRSQELREHFGPEYDRAVRHYGEPGRAESALAVSESDGRISYADRFPFHYPFAVFPFLANGLPLAVHDIGAWGHPRGQYMVEFVRL